MRSFFFRLPSNVFCHKHGLNIIFRGPKGEVTLKCSSSFVERSGGLLFSKSLNKKDFLRFKQAIYGVSLSYLLVLVLQGVGYRVDKVEDHLVLKVGHSHTHFILIPEYIDIRCIKNEIHIRSHHLILLNSFVNALRKLRFPDSYKGSGILYKNEIIRLKEGKKA